MQLRLSPDEDRMLEKLAERNGLSKNQMVATLVREAASKQERRASVAAFVEQYSKDHSELLDRLAE